MGLKRLFRINPRDPGVGVGTANDCHLHHARHGHVTDVVSLAEEKTWIFDAFDPRTNELACNDHNHSLLCSRKKGASPAQIVK